MPVRKEQAVVDLVINGRAAETSIKSIQKATFETERLLRNMSKAASPQEYEKLRNELVVLKRVQGELNAELRVSDGLFGKYKTNLGQITLGTMGGNLLANLGTGVIGGLTKAVEKTYDLADAVSDVKKSTGLARDEVDDLFASFDDMKTRTTREELAKLAYQAGKLGEDTAEGVQGFVRGADLINVALKEDLGGNAEEAINQVGKLIDIFDLKQQFGIEESFKKVGSVINELGGSSSAGEQYIVDFTARLAGIAPAAKISIPEVMGLAAVMDEQGQSTELAATNIGKFLISLGKDIPYFAKVAGMSVKDFTKLLNTNANEALLRVVDRANQSEKGLANLNKTFKTLGIDGSEGAAVIGALANNIDRVRQQQAVANREFETGNSILSEYNEKNNNAAAVLDKIGNKLAEAWTTAAKAIEPFIFSLGKILGVVSEADMAISDFNAKQKSVAASEKDLVPLVKRYNELRAQMYQGKDVGKELNEVIKKITDIVPDAAMGIDKYGNAFEVSTQKTDEFIKSQRAAVEAMRVLAKEKVNAELADLEKRQTILVRELNSKQAIQAAPGNRRGQLDLVTLNNDELRKRRTELEGINAKIKERTESLTKLDGTFKEPAAAAPPKNTDKDKNKNKDKDFTGDGPGRAKKEVDEFKQLKDELRKLQEDAVLDAKTASEREIQVIRFKYDRLRELAKGNKGYIAQLNKLEDEEILRTRGEQAKKYEEQLKKGNDEYNKALEEADKKAAELAEKRSEALASIDEYAATEQQRELAAVDKRFQNLLAQAEEVKLTADQTLPLWEAYWASRAAIEDKYYAEATDKANKKRKQEIEKQGELYTNMGNIFASFLEISANNETEFAKFQKIASLIQIASDTARAISSMVAKGAYSGLTPLDAAIKITGGIAIVLANVAKAKQVINQADDLKKPNIQKMPGRESGGSTDLLSLYMDNSGNPQGYIDRPTIFNLGPRTWMGGEKKKREYVFSNAMLQNPVFADFAAMAETLRTSGYDFTRRADMRPESQTSGLEPLMRLLLAEMQRNTSAVERTADRPLDFNVRRFDEEKQRLYDDVLNRAKA